MQITSRQSLTHRQCLGLDAPKKEYQLVGSQPADIYQQVFGRAPSQAELDALIQNHDSQINGKPFIDLDPASAKQLLLQTPQGQQKSAGDAVTQAQQAQLAANQPAIQTLQSQKASLPDQYKALLDQIKGQGSVATNYAQTSENNLLAQRGITNDSALYGQQMSQALLPVNQQYGALTANLGQGSISDTNNITSAIAQLQTGNLGQSQNYALGLQNLQQQAQTIPSQIALAQASAAAARAQSQYIPVTGYGVYNTQDKQFLGQRNLSNVQVINGQPFLNIP